MIASPFRKRSLAQAAEGPQFPATVASLGTAGALLPGASAPPAAASSPTGSKLYSVVAAAGAYVPQPVGDTYDALVDRASPYLPGCLSGSLARRLRSPAPPPLLRLWVRPLGEGRDAPLQTPATASVAEAAAECGREMGIAAERLELWVEEAAPAAPGLVALLRSTAGHLSSRQRAAAWLQGAASSWAQFLLLPEAVGREVRGQGALRWARQHVWAPLAAPRRQADGLVEVGVQAAQGAARRLLLPSGAALCEVQARVAAAAGLPLPRQRLVLRETRRRGAPERALWAAARLAVRSLLALWRLAAAVAAAVLPPGDGVRVRVVGEGGREVCQLAVTPQTTLAQLSELLAARQAQQAGLPPPAAGDGAPALDPQTLVLLARPGPAQPSAGRRIAF